MSSGQTATDSLTESGQINSYLVSVQAGETILARVAKTSESPTQPFTPRLELNELSGVPLAADQGTVVAGFTYQAPATRTLNLRVLDGGVSGSGLGSYTVTLVIASKLYLVMAGDQGGSVASGESELGAIALGDLDTWSVTAAVGQNLVIRVGEIGEQTLQPRLRLFNPAGQQVATASAGAAVGLRHVCAATGSHLLVIEDASSGLTGTGAYRVSALVSGVPFLVADEGGKVWNNEVGNAALPEGDLDPWSFEAMPGENVTVHLDSLSEGFVPKVQVFSPGGGFWGEGTADPSGGYSFTASSAGLHLLCVGADTMPADGPASYRIRVSGIRTLLRGETASGNQQLVYPVPEPGQILEHSPSLASPVWTEFEGTIEQDGQLHLPLSPGVPPGFFRLAKLPESP